jgi:hypothetical protein
MEDTTETPVQDELIADTETEIVISDYPEVPAETSTEIIYEAPVSQEQTDVSFNVSVVFVLSMILGVLLFSILSRRWYV